MSEFQIWTWNANMGIYVIISYTFICIYLSLEYLLSFTDFVSDNREKTNGLIKNWG